MLARASGYHELTMSFFRLAGLSLLAAVLLAVPAAFAADGYHVIRTYPHSTHAFVQGLVFSHGHLYESDGLYGHSMLREDDLATGRTIKSYRLPAQYFAEGLTAWGNTLVQLTWKADIGFVYDRKTFRVLRTFLYDYQGWGLTQNGQSLIESDGSDKLRFLNPKTFGVERILRVTYRGKPVTQLNELEYIHGKIYSNVWMTNYIVIISPRTGNVLHWISLKGLLPAGAVSNPNAVLNGIAWQPETRQLFVTGKLWPSLFQIRIIPGPPGK